MPILIERAENIRKPLIGVTTSHKQNHHSTNMPAAFARVKSESNCTNLINSTPRKFKREPKKLMASIKKLSNIFGSIFWMSYCLFVDAKFGE